MGHIITFAQQKGGAGKTTILAHLAHSWINAGKSVAIVDLDPQASLGHWAALSDLPVTIVETRDYRAGGDMREAARTHDIVLVDCPGSASSMLEAAIRESNLVITPCQPTAMDVWATRPILDMCAKSKTAARVLLNRVPPRGGTLAQSLEKLKEIGAEMLVSRLGNRVAFSSGLMEGKTALHLSRSSAATVEVTVLRHELDHILKAMT